MEILYKIFNKVLVTENRMAFSNESFRQILNLYSVFFQHVKNLRKTQRVFYFRIDNTCTATISYILILQNG